MKQHIHGIKYLYYNTSTNFSDNSFVNYVKEQLGTYFFKKTFKIKKN